MLANLQNKNISTENEKRQNLSFQILTFLNISKIIERIIHDQTKIFSLENNKFSTNPCLPHSNKILKEFDEGLLTGMILYLSSKRI